MPVDRCGRGLKSEDLLDRLTRLFGMRGVSDHVRSGNGPESTAKRVREWLRHLSVRTLSIEPGGPWGNGHNESLSGRLRDGLLDVELFGTVLEARVLVECRRRHHSAVRLHSPLGYRPSAPKAIHPCPPGSVTPSLPGMAEANGSTRR